MFGVVNVSLMLVNLVLELHSSHNFLNQIL